MPIRHLPSGRRRRFAVLAIVVIAVGGLLAVSALALERRREADELHAMRDSLAALRNAADACRSRLAREESAFLRFDARIDSLRRRIEEYEGMDPEGVPSQAYESYLETFDLYNDSVAGWQSRADSLRSSEAHCRRVVERHNELADSVRGRVGTLDADDPDDGG